MGWEDFLAGWFGGFAGRLFDYPFDTVKVLLQVEKSKGNGTFNVIRNVYSANGIKGFYKGATAPLIGSMAENGLLFVTYALFQRALGRQPGDPELPLSSLLVCAAASGGCVPLVLTPVELIKCRLQVQNSAEGTFRSYKGPIDCIVKTVKEEGIVRGLYRGNFSTTLREVPGNVCWYGTYESFCLFNMPEGGSKADLGIGVHMTGGAMAGVAYWTAFYPADTVKSQIQTNPKFASSNFSQVFKGIYRNEGIRGLYKGWAITAIRAAPAHALLFGVYNETMRFLQGK